jgi:hypothetical protein
VDRLINTDCIALAAIFVALWGSGFSAQSVVAKPPLVDLPVFGGKHLPGGKTDGMTHRQAQSPSYRILVFSQTATSGHTSVPFGIAAIQALGLANSFAADVSESASVFTDASLQQYRAVVFIHVRGTVLNNAQEQAFHRFIQASGGYVGTTPIHLVSGLGRRALQILYVVADGNYSCRGSLQPLYRRPASKLDPRGRMVQHGSKPSGHCPSPGHCG